MKLSFIGWVVLLGLLYAFSKSKTGYRVIYYSLALILLVLLVGNYKSINKIMTVEETE